MEVMNTTSRPSAYKSFSSPIDFPIAENLMENSDIVEVKDTKYPAASQYNS